MIEAAQTDIATLSKFVTLQPRPVEAKWSVARVGAEGGFGPTDTALWAVLRYSPANAAAVARALEAGETLPSATVAPPPAWLLADVDLARFRRGGEYVFERSVSAGKPFASDLYATGFALTLPDDRVLIHFSSR